jgi:hypothetical protein
MWALMCALSLAVAAAAPSAHAQGVDETCALSLDRFDPAVVNVAYPDDSAQYYSGAYQLAPGTHIRIHGRFPHARYMSFNVYDAAQRPLDGVADVNIAPDPGSSNPFRFGAIRDVETNRDYTVFIDTGPKPAKPAPNTIYTGTGQNGAPNTSGTFIYRIYIPDKGRDDTGGVGLPTVTVEPADGSGQQATSPCANVAKPTVGGVNDAVSQQALPDRPPSPSEPPKWRKFVNVGSSVAIGVTGSPQVGPADLDQLGGSGGFLSNLDNAYVSAFIDRSGGQVVLTRFRAPTFPDTRPPAQRMPDGQLRYWSVCTNDPATQRFVACANDDRSIVAPDGFVNYVVSTPEQRPANATRACYVNWLPWGPSSRGVMIYRNMLPAASFAESIQRAKPDHEVETMGEYFPRSLYTDKAGFQARGCSYAAAAPPTIITAPAAKHVCSSRRTVNVTGPRGSRRATVHVGPRVRRVRIHRRKVLVDMRGLPKGRYHVSIRVGGHLLRRVYLTCTPKRRT